MDGERWDHHDEASFWLRHVRTGVLIMVLAALSVAGYALLTWSRAARPALVALAVGAIAFAGAMRRVPWQRLAAGRRESAFWAWTTSSCAFVTVAAVLDGGAESPLVWLYALALIHGAGVHSPLGTARLGAGVVCAYALVAAFVSPVDPARVFMSAATLALVTLISALTSDNLWQQYRAQAALGRSLAELADKDGLTGCLNHRAFHQRLGVEVDRTSRYGEPLALLLIDLDHFKKINDTYGHRVGDVVLTGVAAALEGAARRVDVAARLGGEEFALLLPNTDLEAGIAAAERVRAAIAGVDDPVPVSASIGVSAIPEHAFGSLDMLEQADMALYDAKRRGRNRVEQYRVELHQR